MHVLLFGVRVYFLKKAVYKLKSELLIVKASGASTSGEGLAYVSGRPVCLVGIGGK
jgi:hypothetical protein